jgi:hypothetical protein
MWIPYSLVAVSFTLVLLVALIRFFWPALTDESASGEGEKVLAASANDHGASK